MRWYVYCTPDLFARADLPHRIEVVVTYGDPRALARRWPFAAEPSALQ